MGIRHMLSQTLLQPLPIPASSRRHTLPLPWRLSFALLVERRRRLSFAALGLKCFHFTYKMLTLRQRCQGVVVLVFVEQMVALETFQLDWVTVVAVPFKPLRPHLLNLSTLVPTPILVPLFHHANQKGRSSNFSVGVDVTFTNFSICFFSSREA